MMSCFKHNKIGLTNIDDPNPKPNYLNNICETLSHIYFALKL